MDIFGITLPGAISPAAMFGVIYGAFYRFDKDQSLKNRKFISGYLKRLSGQQMGFGWEDFFRELFTKFFGPRHFSLTCVLRSITLSVLVLTFILFYWFEHHPEDIEGTFGNIFEYPAEFFGLGGVFALACIVDYFTLLKTRMILEKYEVIQRKTTTVGLILLDALSTIIFFDVGFVVAQTIWEFLFVDASYLEHGDGPISIFGVIMAGPPNYPFPIFLLVVAALFTSAWLWLYIVAALVIRVTNYIPGSIAFLGKVMDLDNHPVRSVGTILAGFSAVAVALPSIIKSVF